MAKIERRKFIGGYLDGRELLLNSALTEYKYKGEIYLLEGEEFICQGEVI